MRISEVSVSEAYGLEGNCMLSAYVDNGSHELPARKRPALIVCPGGGYRITSDREAEPVAIEFYNRGYNVYVLRYSVSPATYPTQLKELACAVDYVKKCDEFTGKVFVMGFSAGGHLAACLADFHDNLPFELKLDARPDGVALCYPVITTEAKYCGSHETLLGKDFKNSAVRDGLNLDKHVTKKNPPAYIWHTSCDNCCPAMNSLLFAEAMERMGLIYELHVFPYGVHGLSLSDFRTSNYIEQEVDRVRVWTEECDAFFKSL